MFSKVFIISGLSGHGSSTTAGLNLGRPEEKNDVKLVIILKYLLESSETHLQNFWISILLFLEWLKYLRKIDLIHDTRHHFLGSWDKSNVTWYFKRQKH